MRKTFLLLCVSALLLGGCTMMPKYHRPEAPVPKALPESATAQAEASKVVVPAWREFFTDKNLQEVISLALANNRDLRISTLNVEKARAVFRIQRSSLLPTVSAVGGAENYRLPQQVSSTGSAYNVEQYSALGSASWEIDLFGRLRSLRAKALNQYFATDQARVAAQISLVAAVAENYYTLAA
ncbi:MAG TPA: TolC family protein, partial [Candidatus Aminicenantes bacterium]|nr:TolC family protein [Candidatus Aminicenantes bacterium]